MGERQKKVHVFQATSDSDEQRKVGSPVRNTLKSEKSNCSLAVFGPAILWASLLRMRRGMVRAATALAPSMKESASYGGGGRSALPKRLLFKTRRVPHPPCPAQTPPRVPTLWTEIIGIALLGRHAMRIMGPPSWLEKHHCKLLRCSQTSS